MFPDSPTIRQQVIEEARSWLKTPFHHQSMIKNVGVGCGTFLIGVYGSLGVPVPSVESLGHFPRDWHQHTQEERYLNILLQYSKRVDSPQSGDMVIFKTRDGLVHGHSAVVIQWPMVIHVLWRSVVQYADANHLPLQPLPRVFLSPFE